MKSKETGQVKLNSKTVPVFPNVSFIYQNNFMRIDSYVRKKYKGTYFLIPVATKLEGTTFGPGVNFLEGVLRHIRDCYKCLLFYKITEKSIQVLNERGEPRVMVFVDENQDPESKRQGLLIRKK